MSSSNATPTVVVIHHRDVPQDEQLLATILKALKAKGIPAFADHDTEPGVEWAKEIEKKIRSATAIVPLLSAESSASETLAYEIEIAHETAQKHKGRPKIVPIRVAFTDPLPEPLAGVIQPLKQIQWSSPNDDERVCAELIAALSEPTPKAPKPTAPRPPAPKQPSPPPAIEPIGGAVPVDSKFYVVRPADVEFRAALSHHDSVILVKGARQIGKTSLLARGLKFARENKAQVAMTDFQKFNANDLATVGDLQLCLAESLADQLNLRVLPSDVWDDRRGPNVNFERYLRREVLSQIDGYLVWGLDEVDRLFAYPYASEVFGLFRSWHNERALDPNGPWSRLTLAIAYATEAHLFIADVNQSPFNIGTRLSLEDFYPNQVSELNGLYGNPLKDKQELERFRQLVGGHPYLVRRGLHEMSKRRITLKSLEEKAPRDDGIFGDHLRRILVLLARDASLTEVVKGILQGQPCPDAESFYRLRSAGIIRGTSPTDAQPRCELYATYLSGHLLESDWSPQV